MCYSAMVEQNAKKYALKFKARVQTDLYEDLFKRRLDGEKLYINRAMEQQFLDSPLKPLILEWRKTQEAKLSQELEKQELRLLQANAQISKKPTKKAETDFRIATAKVEKLKFDLERLNSSDVLPGFEDRIFPHHYMSMLYLNEMGEKVVAPFRYLMRPHNKDESFDFKFNGCYNARFDSLSSVLWWGDSFGKRHGLILVSKFYENVPREAFLKHNKLSDGIDKENLVVSFKPEGFEYMFIPTLWDEWHHKGNGPTLLSAALITDDPNPDVLRAGHDRTPIFLKEEAIDPWLFAEDKKDLKNLLKDRESPKYTFSIVS